MEMRMEGTEGERVATRGSVYGHQCVHHNHLDL